jgi:hypothetical protein
MINLNGKHFAKNNNEMINSLFTVGATCTGFYKVNKKTITLKNLQGVKIGVINQHGILCKARKLDNNKYWYSLATIEQVGNYKSFIESINEPKKILESLIN